MIKMAKNDRGFARINEKIKELFEANGISVQTIVDDYIEKNVVFVVDPKTQDVKPLSRLKKKKPLPVQKKKKVTV